MWVLGPNGTHEGARATLAVSSQTFQLQLCASAGKKNENVANGSRTSCQSFHSKRHMKVVLLLLLFFKHRIRTVLIQYELVIELKKNIVIVQKKSGNTKKIFKIADCLSTCITVTVTEEHLRDQEVICCTDRCYLSSWSHAKAAEASLQLGARMSVCGVVTVVIKACKKQKDPLIPLESTHL